MAGAQWDKAYGEHRQKAWDARQQLDHARSMERDAAGHGVTMRGQDLAQGQHKDTHGLARDRLNQQGDQFNQTFNRGVLESDRGFAHQEGRDKIGDEQWGQKFEHQQARDKIGDSQWGQKFEQGVNESNRDYGLRLGQAEQGRGEWKMNQETGQMELMQVPGIQIDRETGMPAERGGVNSALESFESSYQQGQQGGQADSAPPPVESQEQESSVAPQPPRLPNPSELTAMYKPERPFLQTNNPEFWREQRTRLGAAQGRAGANRDRARQEAEERARRGMGM